MATKIFPVQIDLPALTDEESHKIYDSWLEHFKKKEEPKISLIQHMMIDEKDNFVRMVLKKFIPDFQAEKINEAYPETNSSIFDFYLIYDENVIGRITANFDMEEKGQVLNFNFIAVPGL